MELEMMDLRACEISFHFHHSGFVNAHIMLMKLMLEQRRENMHKLSHRISPWFFRLKELFYSDRLSSYVYECLISSL